MAADTFTERMKRFKSLMAELEGDINVDTQLLDQVEALCTPEKSFSYWASVAFGVKPRDVLRNILHEAQTQKEQYERSRSGRPIAEQRPPSEGEGSSS